MTSRYALYFAPSASHPLWRAGCDWLGRDPETGAESPVLPQRRDPRRYGFHATLKPPFALRDSDAECALLAALSHFADEHAAFGMPALQVATLGDFIALRPRDPVESGTPLRDLADECVRLFDDFRRSPTAEETARRITPGLDAQQRAHVARWGYPHVFEHWRFHMTLSDSAPPEGLLDEATRHFADALAQPLRCDGVALFVEDAPGTDFRLARRFEFAR